jgi:hypothetical protein
MNSKTPAVRKRRQSGHVMAEIGLGFFPYFALIFGILDFSMAIFINGAFQAATREGVRFGITYSLAYNGTTYTSQTLAIQAVVEANSVGFLSATNGPTYIVVNYYLPNNLSTVATQASLPQTVNGVNITNINQTGNVMEVRIQNFPWAWMVPLPHYTPGSTLASGKLGITMTETSLDVMQGLPVGTFAYPSP